jgi:Tfp pilus assembly protein PilO
LKKRIQILAVVFAAVSGSWFLAGLLPHVGRQKELLREAQETGNRLADYQRTFSELPAYLNESRKLRQIRGELNSKLYSKEDVLRLLGQLRSEALSRELVLEEISPPVEELLHLNSIIPDSSTAQFLTVRLTLTGEYEAFGRFVRAIEQAGFFRGIERCEISGSQQDQRTVTYNLTFKALLGALLEDS